MQTRRDFLRNAGMLSGSAFLMGSVPEAVARAMAIDPEHGTTFLDAEHIVILMQENRSFDHAYGTLQGVRGYGDPRPHLQADGRPVWFQTDSHGDTYAPFRLDIKNTKVTWIGGLPHSWPDQVDSHGSGHYNRWLIAKPKAELPFTLGHYTREDIPFYYALADAFTVCDQAFCSSLTGTTPNRLFLWTGTVRKDVADFPRVMNEDTDYDKEAAWPTFPERLEDAGVSWKVYQNELSIDSGFEGEQDDWLSNFTDNPLEWFTQYNVRFGKSRRAHMAKLANTLTHRLTEKETPAGTIDMTSDAGKTLAKEIEDLKAQLKEVEAENAEWTPQKWDSLPSKSKALFEMGLAINEDGPHWRELEDLNYHDGTTDRTVAAPKGDTLYRFRNDVDHGQLPAVSWVVAPCNFSDHPGAAWYGAWYVSEVLNILTKNPEQWKKTIFILCYDENDGYFDHVPPFLAPMPGKPETGKVSEGIDTSVDIANVHGRNNSIGLGFRVPLVVASPWTRGGCVNSEVFDHTSIIQFVEKWLAGKGKPVHETNISDWRRTVCGDLTSVFQTYDSTKDHPKPLLRDPFIEQIHAAKFKEMPKGGKALTAEELPGIKIGAAQEPGTRRSCPLPYELTVNGVKTAGGLQIKLEVGKRLFGEKAHGAPFNAYTYGETFAMRNYAVKGGDALTDDLPAGDTYSVRVDGPNGFMRHFKGTHGDPQFEVHVEHTGSKVSVVLTNKGIAAQTVALSDESYGDAPQSRTVPPNGKVVLTVDTKSGKGWYDFTASGDGFEYRFAGRIETGKCGLTDPAFARPA